MPNIGKGNLLSKGQSIEIFDSVVSCASNLFPIKSDLTVKQLS